MQSHLVQSENEQKKVFWMVFQCLGRYEYTVFLLIFICKVGRYFPHRSLLIGSQCCNPGTRLLAQRKSCYVFRGVLDLMTTEQAMHSVPPFGAGHSVCCARRTVGAEGNVPAWKCGSNIQVPEDINSRQLCCDNTSWRLPAQCCQPKSRSTLKTLKMTCLKNKFRVGSIHSMPQEACHHSQHYFVGFISWQFQ